MNQSKILANIIIKNTNSNNITWQKIERTFNNHISHYDAEQLIKKYPNDQNIKDLYQDLKMLELRLKYLEKPYDEDKFKTTFNEQVVVVDDYLSSLYVNDIKIEINFCDYLKIKKSIYQQIERNKRKTQQQNCQKAINLLIRK